ncbi:hypothetical protein [Pseudorhodobacter ferrugineus]|uniref:hypothetical protein n=1 Tax=Pseudorhodobacter ferrugineus TaxID=77008 RepID=UPI0003B61E88|nr:hypothetical protein [Pseudorhodobacter ferrugineus]
MKTKPRPNATNNKPSTAHIDWGLVAAIIAIIQVTNMAYYQFDEAWKAGAIGKAWAFGSGCAIGLASVIGAACQLWVKLRGNEKAPRLGHVIMLVGIFVSILIMIVAPIMTF